MSEFENVGADKPKYEKPLVIDLSEQLMGEGAPAQSCASGPAVAT